MTGLSFAALIALTLPSLYIMLGAAWLLIKTEGVLFDKAVRWARNALPSMGVALLLVSIATPIVSSEIAGRWFSLPNAIGLMPIPVTCLVAFFALHRLLRRPQYLRTGTNWVVYALLILICLMAALGLAYSIYPDIIIGKMDVYEAAAATNSLQFIFYGVAVTLPVILFYSAYVFWVFRGKATGLSYE
jgi:cytochrome d ubiquinol oxidase subunit II